MIDWLRNPKVHIRAALVFVALCVILWPVSLVLTNEPPLILSLSWLALIIPAFAFLLTAKIEDDQEGAK